MADEPLLRCRGLVRAFPGTLALSGVDLTVRAGEVRGLVGHNGAGKSTLVRILAGADRADAGTIEWHGRPIDLKTALRQSVEGMGKRPPAPSVTRGGRKAALHIGPAASFLGRISPGLWPRRGHPGAGRCHPNSPRTDAAHCRIPPGRPAQLPVPCGSDAVAGRLSLVRRSPQRVARGGSAFAVVEGLQRRVDRTGHDGSGSSKPQWI